MDEHTFRAPEPEDNDLPEAAADPVAENAAQTAAPDEREDNDLPASDYIDRASSLFHLSGLSAQSDAIGDGPTRQVRSPAFPRSEAEAPSAGNLNTVYADPSEGPLPPFLQGTAPPEPRQAASAAPAPSPAAASSPVPPDAALMPESSEGPDAGKKNKLRWTLLACGLALLALAAGAVLFYLVKGNPFAAPATHINVPTAMPQTEREIVDFYRIAVNAVKKDGLAGYRKKTWQSVSALELTGIEFVDNLLGNIFEEYVTPENRAASATYEKGSEEAKAQFPAFTLTDLSYVKSADCVRVGDAYQITVVFQHEDTPTAKNSFLGQATDAVIFWDTQIEPALEEISQLHDWSDVHVDYVDMTITAEIGADGRFRSLRHDAPAEVTIGSARLGIFTFTDKSLHLESAANYTDFRY